MKLKNIVTECIIESIISDQPHRNKAFLTKYHNTMVKIQKPHVCYKNNDHTKFDHLHQRGHYQI